MIAVRNGQVFKLKHLTGNIIQNLISTAIEGNGDIYCIVTVMHTICCQRPQITPKKSIFSPIFSDVNQDQILETNSKTAGYKTKTKTAGNKQKHRGFNF